MLGLVLFSLLFRIDLLSVLSIAENELLDIKLS